MEAVQTEIVEALRLSKEKKYEEATSLLTEALNEAQGPEEKAVLHSTLGMLLKKQGQLDEAKAAYLAAEAASPDDPVIKIIIARFFLNETKEYDEANKRAKKILKLAKEVPSLAHQAYSLSGLALLRKGKAQKAAEMLQKSMENKFAGIITAENIDFSLVEAMVREDVSRDTCQQFVEAAYELARGNKEYKVTTQLRQMLDSFETTSVGAP